MSIKLQPVTCSIILVIVATCIGYFNGAMGEGVPFLMVNHPGPGVDFFLNPGTFSEIENTKSLLRAQSDEIIAEVRIKYGMHRRAESIDAIKTLENGIEQLKGTGEELILVQELLRFLKKDGFTDRWLDVYLGVLYNHPTDTLIGLRVDDALLIAKSTKREDELIRGFLYLCAIPIEFDGKHQVEAALSRRNRQSQIARNDRNESL